MDKVSTPSLSIVIPTREGFADHWFNALTEVKGEVEFILVHPPGAPKYPTSDPRVQQIVSPLRGEIIQRISGLMNATAPYTLTINCDEFLHPDILTMVLQYFQRFPDSWVMRLCTKRFQYGETKELTAPWQPLPQIEELLVWDKSSKNQDGSDRSGYLKEIPIVPFDKRKLDLMCFVRERKDHHGPHTENFYKKVWLTQMVQATCKDIVSLLPLMGPFKYIPFWCLDRLLGLFLQAKFFEQGQGKIIGHLMPSPEQLRMENNPPEYRRLNRYGILSEIFLVKCFPQYGYMWNLVITNLREVPKKYVLYRLGKEG
ncbi:MAG: transposase [Microcystis sp. M_OC_Ca_00000000_S217Cul]|uniref:transposase n=1 Tax=unclassified Microcystis TaxID=2643300 RepID=UPI00118EC258|nr:MULTISPECIES: transposase [unclassified Microcystis]TRT75137.1 MAG: transposase [Microcystis sp. M_OC_Ca_00000000_S217Cul]TRT91501.1 MAG: transposase [Microcystis sp. M_OC_Ca_00000000_C217Col]